MTAAANHHVEDVSDTSVVARLDVQDLELAPPLREFLTQHDCQVFVNELAPAPVEYHIVYGDAAFVKEIVSRKPVEAKKRLVIVSAETAETAGEISQQFVGKVALVGPHPLDSRLVNELFAFFYTSHKKLEIFEEAPSSLEDEDRERIADSIANIFGDQHQPKSTRASLPQSSSRKMIIAIGVGLLAPLAWYLVSLSFAAGLLLLGEKQLRFGDQVHAGGSAASAAAWISRAENTLHFIALPFQLAGVGGWFRGPERLLSFFQRLADAEESAAILVGSGKEAAVAMVAPLGVGSGSGSPAIATERVKEELMTLGGSLGLAQSELTQLLHERTWPFGFPLLGAKAEKTVGTLVRLRTLTQELGSLFALYPDIAGFAEKKTYLLLLQNSMELRPTGGFIGSVATLVMSEGRIADFTIHDVYALDGQLKGHVDPPEPIAELLSQEHWYLRDANWDPDFSAAAERAAWFYEKEAGSRVDGVIGINLPLILDLLSVVGPIDLADYNDRITAENFFGKSIYYTQTNFFPGSTQKKDFLGALTTALLTKVTGAKTLEPGVLRVGIDALRKGNLLLWFADAESQAVVARLGWAGRVATEGDRLFWVEANLSVNKVNYFIKRTLRHEVVFAEDGLSTESLAVTLTNTSPAEEPKSGGGTYRVWGRLILPPDAAVASVTLDGTPIAERNRKNKGTDEPPYVVSEESAQSRVIGVALDVGRGQSRQLVVSYRRQIPLSFVGNTAVYDLFIQKQPGMLNTDLMVHVTFPIFWQLQEAGSGKLSFLANQARVTYNMPLSESRRFTIRFQK